MVVAAHPDDDALGCGGAIIAHTTVGHTVGVLYLTSGERGCPGLSLEESIQVREAEAKASNVVMGSEIIGFWHLPDGQLAYNEEIIDRLVEQIKEFNPDIIYVTHEREEHPDHKVAGKIVREALNSLDKPPTCLTYEVWTPLQRVSRVLNISSVADIKLKAIMKHKSQIDRNRFDEASMSLARYRGAMQGGCQYAEVFGRIGREEMNIAVALMTYAPTLDHPRAQYAYTTLESFLANVQIGNNNLHVHIADDGSAKGHVDKLVEIARKFGFEPSISNAERGGYGRSYNLLCQALHSDFDMIFPLEDDWQTLRTLYLEPLVRAIENSNGEIKSIRLGYLGFTQPVLGKLIYTSDQTFLILDPNSPEPHVFAGGPRLETPAYEREIGEWPEGISAGNVEWEVTHRWPARLGVAWPMDIGIPAAQTAGAIFGHIGAVSVSVSELNPKEVKV